MLREILLALAIIITGWSTLAIAAVALVVGVGKAVRAWVRRASARRAAAAAYPEQINVPVLLDLRRPARGGRHR